MRHFIPALLCGALCCGGLGGCGISLVEPAGALAAASAPAVPVFGRSLPDMLYSAVTGRDCSIVRLEQGKSYCRQAEPPVAPPLVCTRSLGVVDCWSNPEAFAPVARTIADAPQPTAEQEAYRTRSWPNL